MPSAMPPDNSSGIVTLVMVGLTPSITTEELSPKDLEPAEPVAGRVRVALLPAKL
jgi:hypothetical protein